MVRREIGVSVLVAGALSAAGILLVHRRPDPPAPSPLAGIPLHSDSPVGGPGAGPRRIGFDLRPGVVLAWSILFESRGSADTAFLTDSALGMVHARTGRADEEVVTTLRGVLAVRFFPDPRGGWWASARLAGDLLLGGRPSPDADLLDRVFLVHMGGNGLMDRFRFAEGLPGGIAGPCRGVLEEMETVLPPGPSVEWSSEEVDLQGTVLARYRLLPGTQDPGFALEKSKSSYLALAGTFPRVADPRVLVLHSAGTARRGPADPWLASVDREESLAFVSGGREFGRVRTRFRASAVPPDDATGPPPTLDAALAALGDPGLLRRSLLPPRPDLDAATSGWDAAAAASRYAGEYRADYAAVRELLLHWLRRSPGHPQEMARWLDAHGEGLGLDVELALWWAMAQAGTPDAQRALAGVLLGDSWSERSKFRALAHASDVPLPGDEYIDSLWEVYRVHSGDRTELGRALHATAAFSIGALGGPDRADRESASRIGEEIARGLGRERDPLEQEILLDAAGNQGGPEVLAALGPFFSNPDPAVRAKAFRALRRMEGGAAVEVLARHWKAEADPGVRDAAAATLGEMPPSPSGLDLARRALRTGLPEAEAIPLVGLLGRTMEGNPENAAELKAVLARGGSMDLRKAVYRWVIPR